MFVFGILLPAQLVPVQEVMFMLAGLLTSLPVESWDEGVLAREWGMRRRRREGRWRGAFIVRRVSRGSVVDDECE